MPELLLSMGCNIEKATLRTECQSVLQDSSGVRHLHAEEKLLNIRTEKVMNRNRNETKFYFFPLSPTLVVSDIICLCVTQITFLFSKTNFFPL